MSRAHTITHVTLAALTTIALAGCSSAGDPAPTDQWDVHAAPEATWEPVAGIAAPMSDNDGPVATDPVPHGYAPNPQGAVLAAINGQIQMATADDETWVYVSQYLLAPGEGRDQWAQGRSLVSIQGKVANPAHFVGFQVADFTDTAATVVLATEWPTGELSAYPVQLTRMSDTWRLVLPTQDTAVDLHEIDTLDGFVPFSQEGES